MPHPVIAISSADPMLTDITALSIDAPATNVVGLSINGTRATFHETRLTPTDPSSETDLIARIETHEIPGDCLTCGLRELILDCICRRIRAGIERTILFLPAGLELPHLAPSLAYALESLSLTPGSADADIDADADEVSGTDTDNPLARLAGVAHLIDVDHATDHLLTHKTASEAGIAIVDDDPRCVAEIHMMNVGYADLVLVSGDMDGAGGELVEHLRPHDTLLANAMDSAWIELAESLTHDPVNAVERVHPVTTQAWGGPQCYGTWTLELSSEQPFHPERFTEFAEELAAEGACGRGCFWLISRPNTVCSWETAGGQIAVGEAGVWADFPEGIDETGQEITQPRCHIIVTGTGGDEVAQRVSNAFHSILCEPHEMAWVGADGLEEWLGE
ncbi:GTP-binding protein [Arcanobacterium canis]